MLVRRLALSIVCLAPFLLAGTTEYPVPRPLDFFTRVIVKTADATLTPAEVRGSMIVNTGDAGAQILTLPAAETGMSFCVGLTAAFDVTVNPDDGDLFVSSGVATFAAGDAYSSAAALGDTFCAVAVDSATWFVTSIRGTWSDVN